MNHLSYNDINHLLEKICKQVSETNWKPELIVGLSRGGLVPAVSLSHYYDVPLRALRWSTRDFTSTECINDLKELAKSNVNILIVDDLIDTGTTMYELTKVLGDRPSVKVAVLQLKHGSYKPDFYGETLHDETWQAYPWEYQLKSFIELGDNIE